jgi:hypothetical protein
MRVLTAALVLVLCACSQQANKTAPAPQAPAGCAAQAAGAWSPAGAQPITVAAASSGPDCATAAISLMFSSGDEVLWSAHFQADQVMSLNGQADAAAMGAALKQWISAEQSVFASTGALPAWPEGAAQPANGEFPFYTIEGMDRDAYEALRARDLPAFCFVQGMESSACVVYDNGALKEIGAQSFPG